MTRSKLSRSKPNFSQRRERKLPLTGRTLEQNRLSVGPINVTLCRKEKSVLTNCRNQVLSCVLSHVVETNWSSAWILFSRSRSSDSRIVSEDIGQFETHFSRNQELFCMAWSPRCRWRCLYVQTVYRSKIPWHTGRSRTISEPLIFSGFLPAGAHVGIVASFTSDGALWLGGGACRWAKSLWLAVRLNESEHEKRNRKGKWTRLDASRPDVASEKYFSLRSDKISFNMCIHICLVLVPWKVFEGCFLGK